MMRKVLCLVSFTLVVFATPPSMQLVSAMFSPWSDSYLIDHYENRWDWGHYVDGGGYTVSNMDARTYRPDNMVFKDCSDPSTGPTLDCDLFHTWSCPEEGGPFVWNNYIVANGYGGAHWPRYMECEDGVQW